MRAALHALLCAALTVTALPAASGGGVTGAATEWTQLLNNAELGSILSVETRSLHTETRSLQAELEQVRTQLEALGIMQRNIRQLPEQHLSSVIDPVLKLARIASEASSISHSGSQIDSFLRSDLITDPLFERRGLDRTRTGENYTEWNRHWQSAVETNLQQTGLTLEDARNEAMLLDAIQSRFGSEVGQVQVLQGANQIAASLARQMNDLRRITATQSEQVAIAWSRKLAEMDEQEALERATEQEMLQTIQTLDNAPQGRTLNDIFGVGE